MRHVVLSGAIATGPLRMVHPTAAAGLVAPPGRALGVAPSRLCTALCAVNLATVAVAADQRLSLAAHAQKQSGSRRRRGQQRTWTRSAMTGILPRHACSARCGARRRSETWPLRSAPCRPRQSDRFLPRVEQAAQGRNPPRPQACGFVDNTTVDNTTECCPQPHRPTAAADNLNDLEISSVRATPGSPPQRQPSRRPGMGATTPSAIFTRVRTAVHERSTRQHPARRRGGPSCPQHLADLTPELASVGERDIAYPLPDGRGEQVRHSGQGPDPRELAEGPAGPRYL